MSLPLRLDRSTGEVVTPGDGAAYSVDVRRLFPAALVPDLLDGSVAAGVDQSEADLRARAARELPDA